MNYLKLFSVTLTFFCILFFGTDAVHASGDANAKDMGFSEERVLNGTSQYTFEINSVEDLVVSSELVVRGKILPVQENVIKIPATNGFEGNQGYTLTKIEITEVLSGEISIGDIITIIEYCYEAPIADRGNFFITLDGYLPSIVGREYILFLNQRHSSDKLRDGNYETQNTILGRYLIPEQADVSEISADAVLASMSNEQLSRGLSNNQLGIIARQNSDAYRKLYRTILDKYYKPELTATQKSETPEPNKTAKAQPTSSPIYVNGSTMDFEAYLIDGYNYFKLRDVAYALSGTEKQFEVGYNEELKVISLTTGKKYTVTGEELRNGNGKAKEARINMSEIYLDGSLVELAAYNINGYNFFKLRDLGGLLDFAVGYNVAAKSMSIHTTRRYSDFAAVPIGEKQTQSPEDSNPYYVLFKYLYDMDTGLNDSIKYIAIDMSGAKTEYNADFIKLMNSFCENMGITQLEDNYEGLVEKGLIKDRYFEDGIIISFNDESFTESKLVTSITKWRSGLGAIGGEYTLEKQGNSWSVTERGWFWIS